MTFIVARDIESRVDFVKSPKFPFLYELDNHKAPLDSVYILLQCECVIGTKLHTHISPPAKPTHTEIVLQTLH